MRFTLGVCGLTVLLLCAPSSARSDAIYQYDGNPFQMVAGRYTTSDSVEGMIQVASVLAPNLANAVITLDSWSFSDGLKTFTPANSNPEPARVSTDAGGHIVNWTFDFSNASGEIIGTFNNGPGDEIDQATNFGDGNSLASNENVPGTWTLVPEPASGTLAALSLTLLALTTRLRRI